VPRPVHVLHIITQMVRGTGASHVAEYMVSGLSPDRFRASIAHGVAGSHLSDYHLSPAEHVEVFTIPDLARPIAPHRDLRALGQLRRLIRETRPDIVHTHSSKAGVLGRLAAAREGVPLIVHHVHGWSFHPRHSSVKKRGFVAFERYLAKRSDGLLFVGRPDIEKGRAHHIGRESMYYTVRAGVDLARFVPRTPQSVAEGREILDIPDDAFLIGTVGRLSPQKAPHDFIAVARRIADELPNARFAWIGHGIMRDEVRDAIDAAGLTDRFALPGARDDVERIYPAFDMFLITSLWEGLPRTIVESLATGVPVVASAVDGSCEIVRDGENGLLFPPGQTDAGAEAVLRMATDDAMRDDMAAAGPATAKDFEMGKSIADLEGVYDDLLDKRRFSGRDGRVRLQDTDEVLDDARAERPPGAYERWGQRAVDICVCLVSAPLALLLVGLGALLVRISSPGPAIFRQERVGKDERPFTIYKLRTMKHSDDSVIRPPEENDSRVTPAGRLLRQLRFDELPQLVNVLKGDMSIIGPRPERPGLYQRYLAMMPMYSWRKRVRPGLTGWAQIHHTHSSDAEAAFDNLQYDLYYVINKSFWLDLSVLLATIPVMLAREGRS